MRTPAYHYFSEDLYQSFEDKLTQWGQENLGCHTISPPWLSFYVDGCGQNLHADIPHGPWAYVYSLTPWEDKEFTGGETQILRPEIMNLWQNFDYERGLESNDIVQLIAPEFNRLTVFDPRLPHGVKKVKGTQDPRKARLVIHGWFVEPRPFFKGGLDEENVVDGLNQAMEAIQSSLSQMGEYHGNMVYKIGVDQKGSVSSVKSLTNTLVAPFIDDEELSSIETGILQSLEKCQFDAADEPTEITLPLLFLQ